MTAIPATDPAAPGTADHFRDLPPLGVVETDRFCAGCGYNLRQQAVRREPTYRLLLVACPECGTFDPVSRDTSTARLWQAWGVRLLLVIWLAAVALLAWIAVVAVFALTYEFARGAFVFDWNSRGVHGPTASWRTWDAHREVEVAVMASGCVLTGWSIVMLMATLLPHWWRVGYAAAAGAVIVVGASAAGFDLGWTFRNSPELWPSALGLLALGGLLMAVGGAAALWLGRPAVRGLVRLLVPPGMRAPLAYLWHVDGKAFPARPSPPTADSARQTGVA